MNPVLAEFAVVDFGVDGPPETICIEISDAPSGGWDTTGDRRAHSGSASARRGLEIFQDGESRSQTVVLDGTLYRRWSFVRCQLVFEGRKTFRLKEGIRLIESWPGFAGLARESIERLRHLRASGEPGTSEVDEICRVIRGESTYHPSVDDATELTLRVLYGFRVMTPPWAERIDHVIGYIAGQHDTDHSLLD